jgi:transcription initiation factor TFIIB
MSTLKNLKSSKNKKDLWKLFDSIENEDEKIECLYSSEEINNFCKECNSILKITDEGFYCCSNSACSIIYKDVLDFGAEWRYYGADDTNSTDPTRCGMPVNPLLKESSFSCVITCTNKSNYGMRVIKRYMDWNMMPYHEKSKYDDFNIITNLASAEGIPKIIIDDAIRYYNKISDEKTYRGLNREGIIAASIYIASSKNNNPRTAKEIAHIFKIDNTSATKGCKNALNILNDIEKDYIDKTELNNCSPSTFIDRYCTKLNIVKELTKLCMFIALKVERDNLIPENTPQSISVGIIHFVCNKCNLPITKDMIHKISGISNVTITKCSATLEKFDLLPSKIIKKYIDNN